MSNYTMLYKYGKRTRGFFGHFYIYFILVVYRMVEFSNLFPRCSEKVSEILLLSCSYRFKMSSLFIVLQIKLISI